MLIGLATAGTSAHRKDEYLQAARIALDPAMVQIDLALTPGIAVADGVLAQVDRDRTDTVSADEEAAYADAVRRAVTIELDGAPLPVRVVGTRFPSVDAIRAGEGSIGIVLAATIHQPPAGPHRLRYRNAHRADVGAYLANALVPASDRVAITAQKRDVEQRELVLDYTLRADRSITSGVWLVPVMAGALVSCAALWRRQTRGRAVASNSKTDPSER